jgi:NifB/MoaA-like Fe-S oxidoreductase
MTTKGIEAQYEEYEEILDEVHRIAKKIKTVIDDEEIHLIIAALATTAIDVVHQMSGNDEDRIRYMTMAFTAAWSDYHSPSTDELH